MYKVVFLDDAGPGRLDDTADSRHGAGASESLSLPFRLLTGYALADARVRARCEIARVPLRLPTPPHAGTRLGGHLDASLALSIAEQAMAERPDMIATSLYVWSSPHALQVAALCRQMSREVTIVAGGPSTLGDAESILRGHPAVDVVIAGEGEEAFLRLLRCCSCGEGDVSDVPFAVFRDGATVRQSDKVHWITELDTIPSAIRPFSRAEITRGGICHFEAARGCPNHCIYCQYSKGNRTIRSYGLDRIIADLDHMRSVGVERVSFVEPSFAVDCTRALAILEYFNDVYVECRIILEANLDQVPGKLVAPLRRLADAGRLFSIVGIQSTNEETLRLAGRRNNLEKARNNASLLFGRQTSGECHVMAGLPGDGFADLLRSLDHAVGLLPGLRPTLFPVMVLPGTALRASAESLGVVYDPSPPHYVLRTGRLSADDMRKAWVLSRVGPRLVEPVVLLSMALGIEWPAPYEEVFDEECFAYTNAYGYDDPAADVFFVGTALRRVLSSRARSADEQVLVSEYIDLLTLLGPEYGAATPEALLDLPSRVVRTPTAGDAAAGAAAGPAERDPGVMRQDLRVFRFEQFGRLVADARAHLGCEIEYRVLPEERGHSAYGFLVGDRKWFLSPGACREVLQRGPAPA